MYSRSREPKPFVKDAYVVMPEPDERTVTLHICDIEPSGTGVAILDTLHILPKIPKKRVDKPLSAAWFQKAAEWSFQRMQKREQDEGITTRKLPGHRIKMTMDNVDYFFRLGSVSLGIRKARREQASPQLRMF